MKQLIPPSVLAGLYVVGASGLAGIIHLEIGGRPAVVAFDAVIYAGAVLVGLWAGLGRHSKTMGFAGVGASLVLVATLVLASLWHRISGPMGPGNDLWVTTWLVLLQLALAVLSMAVVIGAMLWLRDRGVVLVNEPLSEVGELEPFHFSLWQLFVLMAAVGVTIKLGPVARAFLDDYRSYLSSLIAVAMGGLVLGAVGLAALWAVFGGGMAAARIIGAIAIAAALGFLPPHYFPALLTDDVGGSIATTSLESFVVMAMLAVVRAGGYRLIRRTQFAATPA